MLTALLTLFVFGILGIVLLSVIAAVIGTFVSLAFGLVGFLLFKVAPVLLVGWVVLKLVDRARSRRRISVADQKWLDS
jgi:hypothetical protein